MRSRSLIGLVICSCYFACGSNAPVAGSVRFINQAPIAAVNDRLDVPKKPKERKFSRFLNVFDSLWVDAVTDSLKLRKQVRARNVNSIDEVPNSTWFQNRIGVRSLSIGEIQRGPKREGRRGPQLPLTIVSSKVGGGNVGFIVKDANGNKYLLKFDFLGAPEMDTGAHMIVQRILWACGYNVPEDQIVYFERNELLRSKKAVVKDVFGNKRAMTARFVEDLLKLTNTVPGQPIRGLLSRYIDGIPVGGFSDRGTRDDDPNDTVPHQHRRELRGLQPITAWLGHTDVKEGNTIDAWATDAEDPTRHYLVHYLIDFGNALGTMANREGWQAYSFAYTLDWKWSLRSAVTLGFMPRPWDGIKSEGPPELGLFESKKYDPRWFRTNLPYRPFSDMDRFDGFWGAKLLMRFSRKQLDAIVKGAQYTDPDMTRHVVDILVARQRKTALYWFRQVAPLDQFRLRGDVNQTPALCFDDLMVVYDFERAPISYKVRGYNYKGEPTSGSRTFTGAKSVCIDELQPGLTHNGYAIIRIDRKAGRRVDSPVFVHLARGPNSMLRIIGLWRH